MQGIFRKENTDKALKYGIYRHLPTYEKIIRNLVSFYTTYLHIETLWAYTSLFFIGVICIQFISCLYLERLDLG